MNARIPDVDHALVYFSGELDAASAARIAEFIARAAAGAPKSITADLSQVPSMDSAALGAFVRAWHDCSAAGIELRMRAPQRRVRFVLDVTRTGTLFGL
jgi:anti-anti-sigma factor